MGWFWNSPSNSPTGGKPVTQDAPVATQQKQQRDKPDADPEIIKFLELFQSELQSSKKPREEEQQTHTPAPTTQAAALEASPPAKPASTSSSWFSWRSSAAASSASNSGQTSSQSDSIASQADGFKREATDNGGGAAKEYDEEDVRTATLPTTMSCRTAFDAAYHCNGVGGQWNAVYRYGSVRQCSELWDDFWFCMRTRSYSEERKAAEIREHYRQKEYNKYYAPGKHNSEEVWESRDRKLPEGSMFRPTVAVLDETDDEWRARDHERRRKLREEMNFRNDESQGQQTGGAQ